MGICKAFISSSKYIIDLTYFSAITTKQQRVEKHSRNNIIQTIATTVSYFYDTPCFRRNNEYCKDISTYKPFDESCLKINDGSLLMTGDKFLCEYVNKTLLIFISIYNIQDFKLNNLKTIEISLIGCVYISKWSLKGPIIFVLILWQHFRFDIQ